jgi:hypothetical protein
MELNRWARGEIDTISVEQIPGCAVGPKETPFDFSTRREAVWAKRDSGRFRPNHGLHALAPRWRLKRRGAICATCFRRVFVLPHRPPYTPRNRHSLCPQASHLSSEVNVSQGVVVGHEKCLARWW